MRPHKTKSCLLFVLLALLYGCAGPSRTNDGDLVFLGTVEKLQPSAISESPVNWVIEFRVDQVLSGTFNNKTFSFRIHRPSLSGLEVGKQYRVEAKWNGNAYSVDPDQWLKKAPNPVSKESAPLSRQGEIHKPTPEEISRLFKFPEDFTLHAEVKPGASQTALGTFLWEIEYSNLNRATLADSRVGGAMILLQNRAYCSSTPPPTSCRWSDNWDRPLIAMDYSAPIHAHSNIVTVWGAQTRKTPPLHQHKVGGGR